MIILNEQVSIILMDQDNNGHSLKKLNKWAKKELTEAFGGVTIEAGAGTWLENKNLYEDKNHIYKCNYSEHLTPQQNRSLLKVIKCEFVQGKQEAVSVMNGTQLVILERSDLKQLTSLEIGK